MPKRPPVQQSIPPDADELALRAPNDAGVERTVARELALQVLYELDSTQHAPGEALQQRLRGQRLEEKTVTYLQRLVTGVIDHRAKLDRAIQAFASEWPVDMVAIIDRTLLRLAVLEIAVFRELNHSIIIDEAVTLAEKYGADSAPRFVNGVLGAMVDDLPRLRTSLGLSRPAAPKRPTPPTTPPAGDTKDT